MKTGLEIKKLGEVCYKGSSNISQNKIMNDNGDYPIFGASGFIKNVSFYHQDKEYIAVVKDGAGVGRITLLGAKSSVIGTLQYLLPKENIDTRFLYYFLIGMDWNKYKNGSTIPHIYFKDYCIEPFPIFSLYEQQRIVSILDEAFAAIDKAKENILSNLQNSKELFQSELYSIFAKKGDEWVEKKLGDVFKTTSGGTPLKSNKLFYENGNIPWLRSGEICKDDITESEIFITSEGLQNSSAKIFPINTVLIALYGATAGQVGILKFESSTNQAICGIFPEKNYLPEFLLYVLKEKNKFIVSQTYGSAQPNLSQEIIKSISIPIPPFSEQKQIVIKFKTLSAETKKLESMYQQKLNSLEELKKSILQKAFNGELKTSAKEIAV